MIDRSKLPESELISIDQLVRDEALQPRASLDEATIAEYAEAMINGADFPAIYAVLVPEGDLIVLDGSHRVAAAKRADRKQFEVRVWRGTREEAIEFAAQCNSVHGLRRTEGDLRKIIAMLRSLPRWRQASDREIARHCFVSHATVSRLSKAAAHLSHDETDAEESIAAISDPAQTKIVHRGGQEYPMKIGRIGVAQERRPSPKQVIADLGSRIAAGQLTLEDAAAEAQALPIRPTTEMLAEVARLASKKATKREARLARKAPKEAQAAVRALSEVERDRLLDEFIRLKHVLAFRLHALDGERRQAAGEYFNSIAVDGEKWAHWALVRSWAETQQVINAQEDDGERRSLQ